MPNSQLIDVTDPEPGQWTAKILWGGKDIDLAVAQTRPGPTAGRSRWPSGARSGAHVDRRRPVTIPAHSSAIVPLSVTMPSDAGDWPESVEFTGDNGAKMSYAITRRSA